MTSALRAQLERRVDEAVAQLRVANAAREAALPSCRRVVQLAGSAIKAAHRLEIAEAERLASECEAVLRDAQSALEPHPALAQAGFLLDAEKEYVEARVVQALIATAEVPSFGELTVGPTAWMRGTAEAASELRRHLLDRLRHGELEDAERLLDAMDDVYDALCVVDFPDAVTNGLRRTLDALRGVLERSRGDLTSAVVQSRLQRSIDAHGGSSTAPRLL